MTEHKAFRIFPAEKQAPAAPEVVRAASYVVGEISANIELAQIESEAAIRLAAQFAVLVSGIHAGASNVVLAKSIDGLIAGLNAFEQAAFVRILGAEARVAEMLGKYEELLTRRVEPVTPLEVVNREIVRRRLLLKKVRAAQDELEDERDAANQEIDQISDLLRLGISENEEAAKKRRKELRARGEFLYAQIEAVAEGTSDNNKKVMELFRYKEAVRLIAEGLPSGIIDQNFDVPK